VGGEGGLESKSEGSWFQVTDMTGWKFTTMSKTSALQVSWFVLYSMRGYVRILIVHVVYVT
jgi:hypothetical protein